VKKVENMNERTYHNLILLQAGSASADVATPHNSTLQQAIGMLYGQAIAKELVQVEVQDALLEGTANTHEDEGVSDSTQFDLKSCKKQWTAQAFLTSPNYQAKRFVFLLFINRAYAFYCCHIQAT
jgi:DNA mismatch repair protein MLH1